MRLVVLKARDGSWVRTLSGPAGTLKRPVSCTIASSGPVLVTDSIRNTVVVFKSISDERVLRTLPLDAAALGHPAPFSCPWGVSVIDEDGSPTAVVSYTWNQRIALYRIHDGALLRHIGVPGHGMGKALDPRGVCATVVHDVIVSDETQRHLQVVTPTGHVVAVLDPSRQVGPLGDTLPAVAVRTATGEVLVVDTKNHRVLSLCWASGSLRSSVNAAFGGHGSDAGQLNLPWGVAISSSGQIWVTDWGNHRLCAFH
jgi:DNA-binding beta-propeller fold protein YncE